MKQTVIGVFAHVDAGKTSLISSVLRQCSTDAYHQSKMNNAFLDYNEFEKKKEITVWNKILQMQWNHRSFILIDTPGHKELQYEMYRCLTIIDYAIVVVDANDMRQSHTTYICSLLKQNHVPFFVFINKMDLALESTSYYIEILTKQLQVNCIDLNAEDAYEQIALTQESILDEFLTNNTISLETIKDTIDRRVITPCFFGSAKYHEGIKPLLDAMHRYTRTNNDQKTFKGYVYKISYDKKNQRLTHIRLYGGSLSVKQSVNNEKINEIRIYHSSQYQSVKTVEADSICVLVGLDHTYEKQWIGVGTTEEKGIQAPEAIMRYQVQIKSNHTQSQVLQSLKTLEEEITTLNVQLQEDDATIYLHLQGALQQQLVPELLFQKDQIQIELLECNVILKASITTSTYGIACFALSKHYAQVQVLIEPSENETIEVLFHDSCVALAESLKTFIYQTLTQDKIIIDEFQANLFRVKITILQVLTKSYTTLTDVKEALMRAVYQGLSKVDCNLYEPYYQYKIQLSQQHLGKIMTAMNQYQFQTHIIDCEEDIIRMECVGAYRLLQPFFTDNTIQGILQKIESYSYRYEPVIDSQSFGKNLQEVAVHMKHLGASILTIQNEQKVIEGNEIETYIPYVLKNTKCDKELEQQDIDYSYEIDFTIPKNQGKSKKIKENKKVKKVDLFQNYQFKKRCILLDGYNILFEDIELQQVAKEDIHIARDKLIQKLQDYQGFKNCLCIVVFDAQYQENKIEKVCSIGDLFVIYTKRAQTADAYIEKVTQEYVRDYLVQVVTSDATVQMITFAKGAYRMSSREMLEELRYLKKRNLEEVQQLQKKHRVHLLEEIRNFEETDT